MRAITKQVSGNSRLNREHIHPPENHTQATSRWRHFGYKSAVKASLLDEQYLLCCYSELRADQVNLGYHIEHVENKSQSPERTFDYTNLAASALVDDDLKSLAGLVFGGHAPGKQKRVNPRYFVSCHQRDCQRYFAYLSDGRVEPAFNLNTREQRCARYTIALLNLNSPYLIVLRQQWWDELDKLFQEHQIKGWSLGHLTEVDLIPTNGKLSRFFSLTRQFFGSVAEKALDQHAPALI
jgi:uncharacterized protein (TIGR02646 family)